MSKIFKRCYWHNIIEDVKPCIKTSEQCQKQGKLGKTNMPDLQSIPVPHCFNVVWLRSCNVSKVEGFKHLILCINYFSKWSKTKLFIDMSAPTIKIALNEVICCHVCMAVQTNGQSREFGNEVSDLLH